MAKKGPLLHTPGFKLDIYKTFVITSELESKTGLHIIA